MGLPCRPEAGVISDFANVATSFSCTFVHTHAKAEFLLLLQSLLVGNELFLRVPLSLRKHLAFAVDTKGSKSCIALYHCLITSENNTGNDDEAPILKGKTQKMEGFYSPQNHL